MEISARDIETLLKVLERIAVALERDKPPVVGNVPPIKIYWQDPRTGVVGMGMCGESQPNPDNTSRGY